MKINLTLHCPCCQGSNINKNGFNRKQKYLCKNCGRQFIGDHALSYKGCHSQYNKQIQKMTVHGCSIRDICAITGFSRDKVQAALKRSQHHIQPKQSHYDVLETDEFHTFIGKKSKKVWLIYAYHRQTAKLRRMFGAEGFGNGFGVKAAISSIRRNIR